MLEPNLPSLPPDDLHTPDHGTFSAQDLDAIRIRLAYETTDRHIGQCLVS